MPKYSFKCNICGEGYTVNTSWQEKEKAECPKCGSRDKRPDYRSVGVIASSGSGCDYKNTGGICPSSGGV